MDVNSLSVIWASREDDYGDGVNHRLVRSISNVQEIAEKLGVDLDLVVVDWNSPDGRSLSRFCKSNGVFGVRVVEVPASEVIRHAHHTGKPFEEYLAKNVGVRRALGENVAVINPDVVVSEDLLKLCVSRPFLQDSFMRADRLDVRMKRGRVGKKLRLNVRHGETQSDTITIKPKGLLRTLRGSAPMAGELMQDGVIVGEPGGLPDHHLLGMHTNAAGDFIATTRQNWNAANGFSENRWVSTMGDALMVARLTALRLRQVIAPGPSHLFHEDHPSDPARGGAWNDSMWPELKKELVSVARSQQQESVELPFGMHDIDLPEFRL